MATQAAARPQRDKKTAVVVIHGMGEQWPMDTLRGFVRAAWSCDQDLVSPRTVQIYSKPDQITGSFELRRMTTRPWTGADPRRVDFFEFYWAHMMQGNTLGAVVSWIVRLLVRRPSRVPKRLLGGWIAGLVVLAASAALAAISQLAPEMRPGGLPLWVWSVVGVLGTVLSALWLKPVAGDAARYLSPAPGNVAARQAIREAGIDLLAKLHAADQYDRIVVVGHSLGTVVGYDVLNYAWGRIPREELETGHTQGSAAMAALGALERAAGKLAVKDAPPGARTDYRAAQRRYFDALATLQDAKGKPLWLVSDFVTLGSPLSSSDVLLARDARDLEARKALRDTPTCPPWLEKKKPPHFSYPIGDPARIPHHAAVFAPTVWTNVYFPSVLGLFGDFISGRVAPLLGPGVRDVRVPIGGPFFRHLAYWSEPTRDRPWIRALRRAINLRGRDEAALWGVQTDSDPVRAEKL